MTTTQAKINFTFKNFFNYFHSNEHGSGIETEQPFFQELMNRTMRWKQNAHVNVAKIWGKFQ